MRAYKTKGKVVFGKNVYIGPYCLIGYPEEVSKKPPKAVTIIGDNVQIHSHSVISQNTILGNNINCGNYTFIGENSIIEDDVEIMYGAKIFSRVKVGKGAWVGGFVCNDAVIESNCVVMGKLIHTFTNAVIGVGEPAPVIRKGAFIGMNAVVIGGIEVGENAYIAAGAVLTKSALAGKLYCGIPAKCTGDAPKPFKKTNEGE